MKHPPILLLQTLGMFLIELVGHTKGIYAIGEKQMKIITIILLLLLSPCQLSWADTHAVVPCANTAGTTHVQDAID